jgi:beta-glucosidase
LWLFFSLETALAYTGKSGIVIKNGIGTNDDTRRIEYIRRSVIGVHNCLQDGNDITGYCYWSIFDNYEWTLGYQPTFGLIAVDRTTQTRTPKPSATCLDDIERQQTALSLL